MKINIKYIIIMKYHMNNLLKILYWENKYTIIYVSNVIKILIHINNVKKYVILVWININKDVISVIYMINIFIYKNVTDVW